MANEKRLDLIDRNELIEEINQQRRMAKTSFPKKSFVVGDVLACIYSAPAVDAVEVVRCKDCKYFSRDEEYNRAWCNYYSGCLEVAVNGYCYHGAQMNGGNTDEQS